MCKIDFLAFLIIVSLPFLKYLFGWWYDRPKREREVGK